MFSNRLCVFTNTAILITAHNLEDFSKLIDSTNKIQGTIVRSNQVVITSSPYKFSQWKCKEAVPKECAILMWTARVHKQVNITSYIFDSFV